MGKSSQPRRYREISRDAIIDAALRIVDSDGLEALTIRRVAEELDCSAMGLYRHIETRQDIVDGLIDRALEALAQPIVDLEMPWDQQLRSAFLTIHEILLEHPGLIAILWTQAVSTERAMRAVEQMLGTLRRAGFTAEAAIATIASLQSYTYGFSIQQRARTAGGGDAHLASLRALPPDRFPEIHAVAADFSAWTTQAHFESGLDWLLDGIRRGARDAQPDGLADARG